MERTRCTYCRNPIKPHQASAGPDASYHEDCWPAASSTPVLTAAEQQSEYSRTIAEKGLSAVLAPYVSVFPPEQRTFTAPPEPVPAEPVPPQREPVAPTAGLTGDLGGDPAVEGAPAVRREPNFVIVGQR